MDKIVLTGGTYAGKTALLQRFGQDGFKTIPDIGFEVISLLNESLGQAGQREFRAQEPHKFYKQIILRQLASESAIFAETVILDRGVYDYIAMLRLKGVTVPSELYDLAASVQYGKVFMLDTVEGFDPRTTSGRSLTEDDSRALRELIEGEYRRLGCDIQEVGQMPMQERYEYVRSFI